MSSKFFDKLAAWDKVALDPASAMFGMMAAGSTAGGADKSFFSPQEGKLIGIGLTAGAAKDPLNTASYMLNKNLFGLTNRVRADEEIAKRVVGNIGDLANKAVNKLVGEAGKKYEEMKRMPKQRKALESLLEGDEVISRADPTHVAELYNTMKDIAPKMTTHREAVRAFLRQGLAHEGGLDPMSLGSLAQAEQRLLGKSVRDSD